MEAIGSQATDPSIVMRRAMPKPGPTTSPDPRTPSDPDLDRDLDEALEETFPASDPISPMEPREKTPPRRDA